MARARGLFWPAGSAADGGFDLVITPEEAGWAYSSLRVLTLPAGASLEFESGAEELIALPLSGGADVTVGATTVALAGRASVFSGVTDSVYVPIESRVRIASAAGCVVALPGARADRELPVRLQPASAVDVQLRGSGSATRQVNNFGMGAGLRCVRMLATEVLTPAGNWSSYPPHKHDEVGGIGGTETELEEIYYYLFAPAAPTGHAARGARAVGYQRVYGTADRPIDLLEEVTDGDVVLVPHGWHGPSIASPSHHMYYLNVMAGPGAERAWGISDDPDHGWVRETWQRQPTDPRLPFYSAPAASADAPRERTDMSSQARGVTW